MSKLWIIDSVVKKNDFFQFNCYYNNIQIISEKCQPIIPESARAKMSSNRLRMFCAGDQQYTFKTM